MSDITTHSSKEIALRTSTELTSAARAQVYIRSPFAGLPMPQNYTELEVAKGVLAQSITDNLVSVPEHKVTNWFCKDLYSRWIELPAGSISVTEIHKFEHFFFIISGTCTVKAGDAVHEITGPQMFISHAGSQRIFYANTDVVAATFVANVSEQEDMLKACSCGTYKEFEQFLKDTKS